MRQIGTFILFTIILLFYPSFTYAEGEENTVTLVELSSPSAELASPSATEAAKLEQIKIQNVTQPEEPPKKEEIFEILTKRKLGKPSLLNGFAYAVRFALTSGVPANTVMLVLLLPLLATIIAFFRHIVGLPSLGLLLPIALSITLMATGIPAGILLLLTIIVGTTTARILMKKIRIMYLPKLAMSLWFVSLFIFLTLTVSAWQGILEVKQLSIFPILLLILLSEQIFAIQVGTTPKQAAQVTMITFFLALLGYFILSWEALRTFILLYPEAVIALVPINFIIGRWFGLRFTEYFRFAEVLKHGR